MANSAGSWVEAACPGLKHRPVLARLPLEAARLLAETRRPFSAQLAAEVVVGLQVNVVMHLDSRLVLAETRQGTQDWLQWLGERPLPREWSVK